MYFIVIAMPVVMMNGIVSDNTEGSEPVYTSQFWYDDLVREVNKVQDEYNVDEVILYGPKDYTEGIKELIESRTTAIASLKSLGE